MRGRRTVFPAVSTTPLTAPPAVLTKPVPAPVTPLATPSTRSRAPSGRLAVVAFWTCWLERSWSVTFLDSNSKTDAVVLEHRIYKVLVIGKGNRRLT